MIEPPWRARIYVDSNLWIYFLEGGAAHEDRARRVFRQAAARRCTVVTSELTIAECLHRPARMGSQASILAYDALFASDFVELVPVDGALMRRAVLRGAPLGLKLADAVHYLTAIEAGCDWLVTNDRRFGRGAGPIQVVVPPP